MKMKRGRRINNFLDLLELSGLLFQSPHKSNSILVHEKPIMFSFLFTLDNVR